MTAPGEPDPTDFAPADREHLSGHAAADWFGKLLGLDVQFVAAEDPAAQRGIIDALEEAHARELDLSELLSGAVRPQGQLWLTDCGRRRCLFQIPGFWRGRVEGLKARA